MARVRRRARSNDMRRFRIGSQVFDEESPAFQSALANAYERKARPICLCKEQGVPMYVARMDDQYLIKRMPLTGGDHDPPCESYETPYELSGLGALIGSAIQLHPASGMASLKLDFSLSKTGSRAAPGPGKEESRAATSAARRLSLRGLLHFLWHEAGLTKWTARWADKRHWWNIQWQLTEAAKTMVVKGGPLNDTLFAPEQFRSSNKAAIEQRRAAALAALKPQKTGPRKLMVLVGEVKEFAPVRSGQKLVIKHMPGFTLIVDDSAWRRLQARFENELALWGAAPTTHLIASRPSASIPPVSRLSRKSR
jgi:hypothetical protein